MYLWNSEENDFPFSFSSTCKAYAEKLLCGARQQVGETLFSVTDDFELWSALTKSQKQLQRGFSNIMKFYTIQSSAYTTKLPRLSQRALTEITLYVKRCLDVLRTGKSSKDCDSRAQLHEHQRPTTEMKLTKKKITQLFTYERRRLTIRTLSESRSMCTVYEKLKLKIEWVNV